MGFWHGKIEVVFPCRFIHVRVQVASHKGNIWIRPLVISPIYGLHLYKRKIYLNVNAKILFNFQLFLIMCGMLLYKPQDWISSGLNQWWPLYFYNIQKQDWCIPPNQHTITQQMLDIISQRYYLDEWLPFALNNMCSLALIPDFTECYKHAWVQPISTHPSGIPDSLWCTQKKGTEMGYKWCPFLKESLFFYLNNTVMFMKKSVHHAALMS